ncbi:MAG: hypothetical protein Q8K99_04320, partial [Actinomycetota bacterium]|nr:hypothetical protein [Actinomycetota bacterium]
MAGGGFGRSALIGAGVGLVAVVVLGAVAFLAFGGLEQLNSVPERLLVVAIGEDADGSQVAAVIFTVDVSAGAVETESIDPQTKVAIPGTSYEALAEAYSFGGGEGVAAALSRAKGGKPLDWVALPQEAVVEL